MYFSKQGCDCIIVLCISVDYEFGNGILSIDIRTCVCGIVILLCNLGGITKKNLYNIIQRVHAYMYVISKGGSQKGINHLQSLGL